MPKQTPMRLDAGLQKLAAVEGKFHRRSPPKQIEYWADLGRQISELIAPRDLFAVFTGAASIAISYNRSEPVSPSDVLRELEADRASGVLSDSVSTADVVYGVNPEGHELVRYVKSQDSSEVGHIVNGRFVSTANGG